MKKIMGIFILFWMVWVSKVSAQETAPQDISAGVQSYQAKNYAEAESSFLAALKLDPNNPTTHQYLGNVYTSEGRKAEAMAQYQQALSLHPDNPSLKAYVQSQQPETEIAAPPPPSTSVTIPVNSDSNQPHAIFGVFGGPAFWGGIANEEEDEYEGQSFSTGIGAGVYVGCQFNDRFSVSLSVSEYTLPYKEVFDGEVLTEPGVSLSLQEWQLLTVCKYNMGNSGFRPYISVGMGANLTLSVDSENGYSSNYAATAPLLQFGAGAVIPLSHEWDAFVEADYDLALYVYDNEDESFSFFPINLGVQYNLP